MSKQRSVSPWECEIIDYDNVSPETVKEWEKEIRRKNQRDMRRYLKRFPDATPDEKEALRSWVRAGNSPYENDAYVVTESGAPMDFIGAQRFLEEEYQEYLKDPEAFRGCPDSDAVTSSRPSYDPVTGEELPF